MSEINKDLLLPYLIYSRPYQYKNILLYPVSMENVIEFLALKESIIIRKDSTFRDKKIIKMSYLEFLVYCYLHPELEEKYHIIGLQHYLIYALGLLQLVCKEQEINIMDDFSLYINKTKITPEIFDDLRRIILIQNGVDFNIDEFIHYDTEQALKKAREKSSKNVDDANIEDYVDSLCVALGYSEEQVMKMSIRKFWRLIKRYNLHENYTICKTGEQSGMVKYKEPIKFWISSIDEEDQYKDVKANEGEIRSKVV